MMPKIRMAVLGCALVLGRVSPALNAADAAAVEPQAGGGEVDRFTLKAGVFVLSNIKTTLSLDPKDGSPGSDLDYEEDLGGDSSLSLFRADGIWRIASNHRIGVTWFDIGQTTRHELTRDITWGGEVYPIHAVVDTELGLSVSKVNYGYTFFRRGSHEVAGLIGAHITRLEAGIRAQGIGLSEGVGVTAPLPVIGIEWRVRLSERWSSLLSYEYFGISIDDRYSGNLSDFQALMDYRLGDHWSLGAGYNRYVLHASVESERLKLSMKHSYDGLIANISCHF